MRPHQNKGETQAHFNERRENHTLMQVCCLFALAPFTLVVIPNMLFHGEHGGLLTILTDTLLWWLV